MSCSCPRIRNSMLKSFNLKRAWKRFSPVEMTALISECQMQMCRMQMCRIFHPDPPSPPQHLGIKTSRTHEGENTCLTCCHRGLKREPRSPRAHRATYYYYKDSGIQTDGPSETSVSACVTEERLMLHFRTDVCGSRKPSEINSKKT